jgi:threonylcarbamoyladenosine tRNA methylthiotransferase MtaB
MNDKIITFGCRLNFSESQIIADHIKKLNLESDVIVIHSCSVTKNADKESMDKVRELIKNNSNSNCKKKIFVTGCSAQLDPEKYLALGVDRVIGNEDKLKIESYNLDLDPSGNLTKNKIWSDLSRLKRIENLPKTTVIEGRTRGLIQIQNGCDHDCTFCVIYKARGKNRSVPLADIFEQIRILVENSYQEIVFTGVDITDYGKDFNNDLTLAKLIKKTLSLFPQISRLRLSSIDVAEIDDELFHLIAYEPRIMPYIHISMQSGSDLILKRMKRRHLSSDIRTFCLNLLKLRPDLVFGADIIAGFPTETEELFQETINLIQSEIPNFVHLHIFPFSAHSGTAAARMPQVNGKIIKERARILRNIHHNNKLNFFENIINNNDILSDVLYETKNIGKTPQFFKVKLVNNDDNNQDIVGKILKTRLFSIEKDPKNSLNPFYFLGELIKN